MQPSVTNPAAECRFESGLRSEAAELICAAAYNLTHNAGKAPMLTKLLAPLIPILVEAVFKYLAKHPEIVSDQVDRLAKQVTDKLPDLSKLDEQILALMPDLSKLPAQVLDEVSDLPAKVIAEIRQLFPPFPFKF